VPERWGTRPSSWPCAAERIRELAPEGVDRVIEVAPHSNLELDLAVVKPHGTVVTYAAEPAGDPTIPVRRLMSANITLRFVMVYGFTDEVIARAVEEISQMLAEGALVPLPTHRFALDRVADAHDAVESGAVGKVLVDIG